MNIKIAKAFRTLSFEASCVLAGVRPIRLAIEEKVRTNKNNIEYEAPLDVRYRPHPAEISPFCPGTIMPTPRNSTNICRRNKGGFIPAIYSSA